MDEQAQPGQCHDFLVARKVSSAHKGHMFGNFGSKLLIQLNRHEDDRSSTPHGCISL
jgi:hypothetical protein